MGRGAEPAERGHLSLGPHARRGRGKIIVIIIIIINMKRGATPGWEEVLSQLSAGISAWDPMPGEGGVRSSSSSSSSSSST
jgi:hypothetical protein